jgi:hypothetical protein
VNPFVSTTKVPSSFGIEVSPSIALNHIGEQTIASASYLYDAKYFEDHSHVDQTHELDVKLDHSFSRIYKVQVADSFVSSQEPDVIAGTGVLATPLRTTGNNLRNTGKAGFTAKMTEELSGELDYQNVLYDYSSTGPGSDSALLDRMEQYPALNLRWRFQENTVGVLGYQFGAIQYNSNESLVPGTFISPTIRNAHEHFAYVGVDQSFNPQLSGSVRVGAQYNDYYDSPSDDTTLSPYADASLVYSYLEGSYVQAGVKHTHVATDVTGFNAVPSSIVLDQEATAAYISLTHKITAKLTGSALGEFQHSVFNGGTVNDQSENFYIAALNLAYHFNPNWLVEAGYNYDKLNSEIFDRSYTRNRVYFGVRATF